MADPRTRHTRGLWVVIGLAAIFFVLLALVVLKSGDGDGEEIAANETLSVLPVRIRIRTEPNARAPVVATATSGERVTLLENRDSWVRVKTGEGLEGWAERANLERTLEQKRRIARHAAIRKLPPLKGVATHRTQLYAGPGIFYPLVGELPEGRDVTVFTRDHDFFAIQHGDKSIAYADVEAIDITASGAQFDVASASTDTSSTLVEPPASTDTVPTETMAEAPPLPEPVPEPAPAPVERSTGVYSAVPAGGTSPEEIDRVVPHYPAAARRANVQGAVVVRGIVRRDGTIDNVEIIKDLPHGLGEAARRAVSRWRFRPGTYRGEPIDVYYTVTVNFRLQ